MKLWYRVQELENKKTYLIRLVLGYHAVNVCACALEHGKYSSIVVIPVTNVKRITSPYDIIEVHFLNVISNCKQPSANKTHSVRSPLALSHFEFIILCKINFKFARLHIFSFSLYLFPNLTYSDSILMKTKFMDK